MKLKLFFTILVGCVLVLGFTASAGCTSIEDVIGSFTKQEDFTPIDYAVGIWEESHDLKTSHSYLEMRIYGDYTYKMIRHTRDSNGWKSSSRSGTWSGPEHHSRATDGFAITDSYSYHIYGDNGDNWFFSVKTSDRSKNIIEYLNIVLHRV